MNNTSAKQRNQTLECCRIVAAVFVVFLHVPFPGFFGGLVACLSRFAVPMFFAISGWYSYRTQPKKLLKRAVRIWLLELFGIALNLIWKCIQGRAEGTRVLDTLLWRIPDSDAWSKWLLFQIDPFAGPLWYLSAAAVCYLVLAVYTVLCRKTDYRLLYLLGGAALAAHFAMAEFSDLTGIRVVFTVYRNAWFFGIPMFTMGLGLRQLWEGLSENRKTNAAVPVAAMAFGVLLSLVEWQHFGIYDLHVGTVITVAGLMLLTAARPRVPQWLEMPEKWFGFLSTGVYLTHLIVHDVYNYFYSWKLETVLGEVTPWLVPPLVAVISIVVSLAGCLVVKAWKQFV